MSTEIVSRAKITEVINDVPVLVGYQKNSNDSASHTTYSKQSSKTAVTVLHAVTDDGAGNLFGLFGTVLYSGKSIAVKVTANYEEESFESNYEQSGSWEALNNTAAAANHPEYPGGVSGGGGSSTSKGGDYGSTAKSEVFGTNSLTVRYKTGTASPIPVTTTYTPPVCQLDLLPYTKDFIVPNTLQFTWMGTSYVEYEGTIYRGRTDIDPGIASGTLDYNSGVVLMTDYVVGANPGTIVIDTLYTRKVRPTTSVITFNTASAPLKVSSLLFSCLDVNGEQLIGTSDASGDITGPHIRGVVDYQTGLVEIIFGDYLVASSLTAEQKSEWWYSVEDIGLDGKVWRPWPVFSASLRYATVSYTYLPLDADILGLDPVRLPQDGRVTIFRPGGFAVLGHTGVIGPQTVSNAQTINCGRVRLSRVRVIGNDGNVINTGYTENLEAGTVTFTDVSGYSQPVTVEHRIEDMAQVNDIQINGTVGFTRAVTHQYPVGSTVSSAIIAGDLHAHVSLLYDQGTFTVWSDTLIGSPATGTYNSALSPVVVTNRGAVTERWAVVFTNTTTFNVMGEHVGVIATGTTGADISPINPAIGQPYFTLPALGWGSGWSAGNVLRFNTIGALFPVWVVRTVQQGQETVTNDSFTLLTRGDVDAP